MKQKSTNTIFKQIIIIILIVFSYPCYSQYQEKHEISVNVGGGYTLFKYYLHGISNTKPAPGYGGVSGLGYTFFFNNTIGIGTGAEVALYNSEVKIDQFSDKYNTFDGEENFEFMYTVNGYKEKQNLLAIQIPLFVQFQFPVFFEEHLTYIKLGGRVGFPLNAKYSSLSESYTTSAYYPQYGALLEGPASQGLGVFKNRKYNDKLNFENPIYILSAEAGMKWMISDYFSLYTGVYFDYTIMDIYKNHQSDPFLKYSADYPAGLPNISILQSRYNQNSEIHKLTGRVFPHALGIKLRLSFRVPDKRNCCF